jgi:Transglycosylase SLT domain
VVLIDRSTSVEHFDYSRLDEEWASLRLLTALGTSLGAPRAAYLVVEPDPGGDLFYAPARDGALERRVLAGEHCGSELLWHATFALPLAVVEAPGALFKLIRANGLAVALPAPWLRDVNGHALALTGYRSRQHEAPRHAFGNARRLAALATAVAITATSTPAIALGVGDGSPASAAASAPAVAAVTIAQSGATPATGPAPTTTPDATSVSPALMTSTGPATAQTPTSAVAGVTPAAAPATHAGTLPSTRSVSGRRVIAVSPSTSGAPRRSPPPVKLIHLFSSPSHAAHHTVANPARLATECSTLDGAGPIAYAATPASIAARNLRAECKAASKTADHGAARGKSAPPLAATLTIVSSAPPASTKSAPAGGATTPPAGGATTPPAAGKPIPEPTSAHPGAPASKHHRAAHSSVTGGASLVTPTTTSPTSPGSVPVLSSAPPGFPLPQTWTGTVMTDPSLTGAVTDLSGLLSNGDRPPSFLIPIYMQAGRRYDVPWEVLASINAIESDYGRDLSTSSAGAVGWMQFEPSTWRQYGMAVDGHSVPNPYDPVDAIFSAARYLAAAGAAQDVSKAVYAYNHATWYVDEVLSRARAIAGHAQYARATIKRGTFSVSFATGRKRRPTVTYHGGVLSPYDRLIAAANMVSAANFPYLYGGGHEQPAQFAPFDCSGSVSYVIQQAGYKVPTTVSGDIPIWKFPAGPGRVTIFYNPVHTYMRIGDRYFGTSGFARPNGGGAGWFDVDKLPAGYLAQFREVHVPGLGQNSFAAGGIPPVVSSTSTHTSGSRPQTLSWSSFKANVQVWMSTLGPFPSA